MPIALLILSMFLQNLPQAVEAIHKLTNKQPLTPDDHQALGMAIEVAAAQAAAAVAPLPRATVV